MQQMTDDDRGVGDLVIPIEMVPVEAFQAIYHKLTERTESLQKRYSEIVVLTPQAVEDLHHHFTQSVSQYNVKASTSGVTMSLENGENHSISSVEKSSTINWASFAAKTQVIRIEYDFLIILPMTRAEVGDIGQRFKFILAFLPVRHEFSYEQEAGIIFGPFSSSRRKSMISAALSIEYSDFAVARTLQLIADEWIGRITKADDDTSSLKACGRVSKYAGYLIPVMMIAALLGGIYFEIPNYHNLITPMRYLLVVVALAVVAAIGGGLISEKISDTCRLLAPASRLDFTKGDRDAHADLIKRRKAARGSLTFVSGAVIVAFIVGLLVNAVSARLIA
ncbi:hypothetical protein [Sphingomonas sp. PP-CE-1G-424]|uniref:hypothetical protein n=1 Tax=Sphingomonas sp. PP-CE-1G-424 TaxID=2135658 RepID=UPI0010547162|nr:hypothetical protein [Sphingomonas sp. PP-CE-1G-424]